MRVGFVMLAHEALERAGEVARHWARSGCPVVIHVDRRVDARDVRGLVDGTAMYPDIHHGPRFACDWGRFSLVKATQAAAELLLARFPDVTHVFLASGACLPLRPVEELHAYLAERPGVDFIESVTTEDVPWTKGGLDHERFTLRFPFSWRRQRRLFDGYVRLQRRIGMRRRIPEGLEPHMGSQWWCLTRESLTGILNHPRRAEFDRYFARVWIPDESYFQTLVRALGGQVESRSLTLSKFDFQGKPHVFYDDHLQLLRRSDCFVARKIWPEANRLYRAFLTEPRDHTGRAGPSPGRIDRLFAKAIDRRTRGRAGLHMAGRFPREPLGRQTCARYAVFEGFGDLLEDFPAWLARETGMNAHGHLFAPGGAEFADGQATYAGALSGEAQLRDYNPENFLTNLVWNTRGERQAFLYGPRDTARVGAFFPYDPNADVFAVAGAWAVPLFRSQAPFAQVRKVAARLQKVESAHLAHLRDNWVKARVRIWSMADFVEAPHEALQMVIEDIGLRGNARLTEMPRLRDLAGFGAFLQRLKNGGMNPHLMGDFPVEEAESSERPTPAKPYVVR